MGATPSILSTPPIINYISREGYSLPEFDEISEENGIMDLLELKQSKLQKKESRNVKEKFSPKKSQAHSADSSSMNPPINSQVIVSSEKSTEDHYRWRKYGQKVMKGSPFPRSYYKCTTQNCSAKKIVETIMKDGKEAILFSYRGTHNHAPPNSKRALHAKESKSIPEKKEEPQVAQKRPRVAQSDDSRKETTVSELFASYTLQNFQYHHDKKPHRAKELPLSIQEKHDDTSPTLTPIDNQKSTLPPPVYQTQNQSQNGSQPGYQVTHLPSLAQQQQPNPSNQVQQTQHLQNQPLLPPDQFYQNTFFANPYSSPYGNYQHSFSNNQGKIQSLPSYPQNNLAQLLQANNYPLQQQNVNLPHFSQQPPILLPYPLQGKNFAPLSPNANETLNSKIENVKDESNQNFQKIHHRNLQLELEGSGIDNKASTIPRAMEEISYKETCTSREENIGA